MAHHTWGHDSIGAAGRLIILKTRILLIAGVVLFGVATSTMAQQPPAPAGAPPAAGARGRGGRGGPPSPEIGANGTITFRLAAPNAREVSVSGTWGGQPTSMTRDANGVWAATVGPLAPEIYTVLMSPAAPQNADQAYPNFFKDVASVNKQFKLLWIGIGKDDTLTGAGTKALDATLTAKGVNHTFVLSEGIHEWYVWRHHLNDVAPLLFK